MDLKFKGKVAVVTGAGKGIGKAVVQRFAKEGASVVILDRNDDKGHALAQEISNQDASCLFLNVECSRPEACQEAITKTLEEYGRLDVLVNNAGFNDSVALDRSPDDFLDSVRKNVMPAYAMTHYAREALMKFHGAVINVGSKVALTGQGGTSGYAAAKGAINALTREWAIALAPGGVRVNAVLPAECITASYDRFFQSQPDPVAARKAIEQLIPLGHRMTTPEEVADMIVFLGSELSAHTTGQIMVVDGGYTHLDRAVSHDHMKWS